MSTINAIYDRHSVRQYQNQPLSREVIHALQSEINACNQQHAFIFSIACHILCI